jgi:hypothetical protein
MLMRRLLAIIGLLAFALTAYAQESALILTRGTPATSTLSADNLARVFFFVALTGEEVTLSAVGDDDLTVGFIVTAADGTLLGQAREIEGERAVAANITIPTTATYFVTVFALGAQGEGTFSLLLSDSDEAAGVTPPPAETPSESTTPEASASAPTTPTAPSGTGFQEPRQVLLSNGLQVALSWSAAADLNLEVRDPVGNTLFFDSRTSPIGGSFGFDANGFCQVISPNPVETATWAPGFLPTGNYEILVFYRQACQTPEPVEFTITVNVNGVELPPLTATLTPPLPGQNSTYLTSFRVNEDTTAAFNAGGVYPDSSLNVVVAPPAVLADAAQPIARDESVVGAVTQANYFQVYSYEAAANEVISASAAALNGSLDTLLQVTDANGNLVAVNDDSNNSTNSEILGLRLGNAGTYYFIVTRYGKEVGGTEGEFRLELSGAVAQVPPEVLALNVPPGEVQVFLTWQSGADVQLLVRDPAGDSVFDDQLRVASGGQMTLQGNINCNRAPGNPVSYIYWPTGLLRPGNYEIDVWYQNQCNDSAVVDVTLTIIVRGQLVTVENLRMPLNQHYVIGFNVAPDGSAQARAGGFSSRDVTQLPWQSRAAQSLTVNVPVFGQITDDNTFNVYTFEGIAGQRVTISSLATSPTLDTKLFLIGPNGVQLAENDDSGVVSPTVRRTDAIIANVLLPENGTYTVVATRYAMNFGNTVGGYSLTVTLN